MSFIIQMSGVPGAGKTTIAEYCAKSLSLEHIDLDEIKSKLLSDGLTFMAAEAVSYREMLNRAAEAAAGGRGAVLDSPCQTVDLLDEGQALAKRFHLRYAYIQCVCDDLDLLDRRLQSRPSLRSQRRSLDDAPSDYPLGLEPPRSGKLIFSEWARTAATPETAWLRLDATRPVGHNLSLVDSFLERLRT